MYLAPRPAAARWKGTNHTRPARIMQHCCASLYEARSGKKKLAAGEPVIERVEFSYLTKLAQAKHRNCSPHAAGGALVKRFR